MRDFYEFASEHPILAILIVWAICGAAVGIVRAVMAPFISPATMEALRKSPGSDED